MKPLRFMLPAKTCVDITLDGLLGDSPCIMAFVFIGFELSCMNEVVDALGAATQHGCNL